LSGFDSLIRRFGRFANWEGTGLTNQHDKVRFLERLRKPPTMERARAF
jgi:hypothetical protein